MLTIIKILSTCTNKEWGHAHLVDTVHSHLERSKVNGYIWYVNKTHLSSWWYFKACGWKCLKSKYQHSWVNSYFSIENAIPDLSQKVPKNEVLDELKLFHGLKSRNLALQYLNFLIDGIISHFKILIWIHLIWYESSFNETEMILLNHSQGRQHDSLIVTLTFDVIQTVWCYCIWTFSMSEKNKVLIHQKLPIFRHFF